MAIKVLVVDDSALMRKYIQQILETDPQFVVRTARDGQDALERIQEWDPDVVTLDINMPVMDGLTCLSRIMTECPRPVVMISSLTEKGALATFEALELGAVDYVAKPGGTVSLNIRDVADEILEKVKAAARSLRAKKRLVAKSVGEKERKRPVRITAKRKRKTAEGAKEGQAQGLVLVGCSTGGPRTLEQILMGLPDDFPWPVLVAQHMPAKFTEVFSKRLDKTCAIRVQEVQRMTELLPATVYIGRGDADVVVSRRGRKVVAMSVPADRKYLWHPSVERMVASAMEAVSPENLIAVQLTGMGYDGAEAMTRLHGAGGRTIAESEETAVVFGMPKELIERGGADVVLPMDSIAEQLVEWVMGTEPQTRKAVGSEKRG